MASPLEGIRVLDLGRMMPGPFCTMILADMGADVIRVEDVNLRFEPPFVCLPVAPWSAPQPEAVAAVESGQDSIRRYYVQNRNKRSIALNLKTSAGRQVFYTLAKSADVVVDEFRPGVTQRLGVDYDTLRSINPRLIYCALTGYGQNGPLRLLPGHAQNYRGMSGTLELYRTEDGQLTLPKLTEANEAGSVQAALGVLLALFARQKTGRGQFVDVSITDSLLYLAVAAFGSQFFATGEQPPAAFDPPHVYPCADGKALVLSVGGPWFWERTCKALGLEQYTPYLDHVMPYRGGPRRQEILDAFARSFRSKPRQEWFDILAELDVPVSPVNTLEEAFSHPQTQARRMVMELPSPEWGPIKTVGIPIKLSETPGAVKRLAPRHGEHTTEILRAASYSEEEIETLRASGAIK